MGEVFDEDVDVAGARSGLSLFVAPPAARTEARGAAQMVRMVGERLVWMSKDPGRFMSNHEQLPALAAELVLGFEIAAGARASADEHARRRVELARRLPGEAFAGERLVASGDDREAPGSESDDVLDGVPSFADGADESVVGVEDAVGLGAGGRFAPVLGHGDGGDEVGGGHGRPPHGSGGSASSSGEVGAGPLGSPGTVRPGDDTGAEIVALLRSIESMLAPRGRQG